MLRSFAQGIALALALAFAPAAAQTSLDLRPEEARQLAMQAVLAGDPALAWEIATALLQRDPEDAAALRVLAAAEPALGRPAAGRRAAAAAWRLADSPERRYEAARLAAFAAMREGRPGLASLWLRLALISAPDAEEEARTQEDAARLRARSPWRWDVDLSFGPSENVNGGSETPYNVIDGLPFVGVISMDGRALSGWSGVLDLSLTRRLAESETRRWQAGLRVWARGVALSEESRARLEAAQDPDDEPITGADFSSAQVEASLSHDRVAEGWLLGAQVAAGLAWQGGEPSHGALRLSAEAIRPLGRDHALSFDGFVEQRWDEERDPSVLRTGLSAEWSTRVDGIGRLGFTLGRGAAFSDNRNAASDSWSIQARLTPAEALGPARLDLRVGAQVTEFPDYAVLFPVPGGRRDERSFAALEATFSDWDVAGFAPVVTLEAGRTLSNVSRFESQGVTVGFGLRSSF